MGSSLEFFREAFADLSGCQAPFPWQEALFSRFCDGDIPEGIALPTGCGKTSVMLVWLLAVSWQARNGPEGLTLPRRLLWVVNRRVVVDQATDEVVRLRQRLTDRAIQRLAPVRHALGNLSARGNLLGISTLRGQFADNGEWRDDPARPAVIVGTIDMIGSRLLFSGYGLGFRSRPLHAGFLGQDTLLVHDEAHLEPAFQNLVETIRREHVRCGDLRPIRVMALTATSRGSTGNDFGLTEADRRPGGEIERRIEARKGMAFHSIDSEKSLWEEIAARALEFQNSGSAVLIFLRKIEDVQNVASTLRKQAGHESVSEFTGTIRGYERDLMAETDGVFARFAPDSPAAAKAGTVYLVSTSAGEVGVNLSAEHLVCDLTPFDSMTQRLGRVNRFGRGDARVELIHSATMDDSSDFESRRRLTLSLLQKLERREDGRYDASPAALERLPAEDRLAAFSPAPEVVPATDVLFDAWSLTTVRPSENMPGRPPVADWLHGIAQWEPPQSYVGWREEVEIITDDLSVQHPPEELIDDYPLRAQEVIRDASRRIAGHLRKIASRAPETRMWLMDGGGGVRAGTITDLLPEEADDLRDCTVLLPPSAGGLARGGMLDGSAVFDASRRDEYDIADRWTDESGTPARCRLWNPEERPDGMRKVRVIHSSTGDSEEEEVPERRRWIWYTREAGSRTAREQQDWQTHADRAEGIARDLVKRAGLRNPEADAIVCAAKWHDLGKRRDLWQRSIGNTEYPDRVLAKSGADAAGFRSGYRHELGSLADLMVLPDFQALTPDTQDLVLHAVAAHHGRARPHFPAEEVFDPECEQRAAQMAQDAPRRFAWLERKYGRWGLAYLESLVRAADVLASQPIEQTTAAGGEA